MLSLHNECSAPDRLAWLLASQVLHQLLRYVKATSSDRFVLVSNFTQTLDLFERMCDQVTRHRCCAAEVQAELPLLLTSGRHFVLPPPTAGTTHPFRCA